MEEKAFQSTPFSLLDQIHAMVQGTHPCSQIDEVKLNAGYALAHRLYNDQLYNEASHFFSILVQARPNKAQFWKGFGASLQMQKRYEEALNCYAGAQILNHTQPDLHLFIHAADCYFALGKAEEGLNTLETAHKYAIKTQDKRVLNHISFMKEAWANK